MYIILYTIFLMDLYHTKCILNWILQHDNTLNSPKFMTILKLRITEKNVELKKWFNFDS